MKVKQLIKKLQKLPQNADVITSHDPEGNGYNLVHFDPEVRYILKDEAWIEYAYDKDEMLDEVADGDSQKSDFKKVVLI